MSHDEWKHRNKQTMLEEKQTLIRESFAHMEQFVSYAEDLAMVPKNADREVLRKKAKQCRALLQRVWKII